MASAYVNSLNSSLPARQPVPELQSLKERFIGWYGNLPAFTRARLFSMSEFEAALSTQGKYLSPVLMSLGWTRRRIYAGDGPYHRYWVPPVCQRDHEEQIADARQAITVGEGGTRSPF